MWRNKKHGKHFVPRVIEEKSWILFEWFFMNINFFNFKDSFNLMVLPRNAWSKVKWIFKIYEGNLFWHAFWIFHHWILVCQNLISRCNRWGRDSSLDIKNNEIKLCYIFLSYVWYDIICCMTHMTTKIWYNSICCLKNHLDLSYHSPWSDVG